MYHLCLLSSLFNLFSFFSGKWTLLPSPVFWSVTSGTPPNRADEVVSVSQMEAICGHCVASVA